ncbi:MAG: S8 family peptidase [Bdellovibrionota bacterium]
MPDVPTKDRLPIKVILPNQGKERPISGGGAKKLFRPVNTEYRKSLSRQVAAIRESTMSAMQRAGSAPARVKLLPNASAKSHRPDHLFSDDTCPIIGAGALGELFIKATPRGLNKLANQIERNNSKQIKSELSVVDSIEPITPAHRRNNIDARDILRNSPKRGHAFLTRVRLFDYGRDSAQDALVKDFEENCKTLKIPVRRGGYSQASHTYVADCKTVIDVESLAGIIGVRSIREMPSIRMIRPQLINADKLPSGLPLPHDINGDFPIVAVVDSGIEPLPNLERWVIGRQQDVAPVYRNPAHGTFVAGLICWGAQLNPHLSPIDSNPCGIFDLEVLPNSDPGVGDTTFLTEEELLQSLSNALEQYANKIKVWNLSLGSSEVCGLDQFSPLAEELDKLQEKFQVTFVISAGNYETLPLLDYPRIGTQLIAGRITSPADSVLGVTVGSISHLEYNGNGPARNHPSAFSRHGAGPNYIIKPDFVHYGGTCSVDFSHKSGIRSVTKAGTAENLGTSFATPLISRSLAQVYHHITPTPSPVLARALLTHHASDPRTGGRVPDGEENYFGFGLPTSVPYCLECTPHSSTLIFEDQLRPGFFLEWDDFPYPPSLKRNGRYYGEIWMTVAFAPARSGRFGSEYCETNIDAHFGIYETHTNRKTGEITEKFKGLVPPEHKNKGILYETYQIEKLRKWAPVRTYHANLGQKGVRGERWRLMLRLLTRHGVEAYEAFTPQKFSLIVTISDPNKTAPIYDEMAQIVRTRFQADNLTIRTAARIRATV